MLASSQTIAPKPAALPPAAQPTLPGSGSAGGPSFAQFLNDQPALPTPPAHADAAPHEPEAHEPAPAPAASNATARRQAAPATAKPATPARSSDADAATPAKPATQAVADDAGNDEDDAAVASTDTAEAPETAGLDEFTQLIGLTAPLTPAAMPAQVAAMAAATTGTQAATPGTATPLVAAAAPPEATPVQGATHATRAGRVDRDETEADDDRKPAAGSTDVAASPIAERRTADAPVREPAARAKVAEASVAAADKAGLRSTDALQTASSSVASSAPHPAGSLEAGTPNFAALLAQALPMPGTVPDAAPVSASGQVHAALHSSAFAPELAASVSLLAVDGVQQAELQLNPADMGPVAVQIVVDGSQAQVSFHAVQAETRQALEQGLPDLAAALQSQGLTLSGGGVFQQTARDTDHGQDDRSGGSGRGSSRTGSSRVGATTASSTAPVRRSVGLLDTFA